MCQPEIKPDKQPPSWLREINLIMWCSRVDVWETAFLAATVQSLSTEQKKGPVEKDPCFSCGSDKI